MIGDIAGSKYEFNNTFDYDFEMFGEGCDFTDDTICTVAIADAILNGRSYQESLLDWCRRYPSPKGAYGGRFAGWIRSLDPQPYNSFGNGSAIRVSPVAWLFDDLSQVLEEAEKTALPTHNHPEGIKGAKAVAHAIWHFRKSKESHLPDDEAMKALMNIEGFRNLNQDIETIINKSDAVKKTKKEANDRDLTKKEKEILTEEEKEYKNLRKQIQEIHQIRQQMIRIKVMKLRRTVQQILRMMRTLQMAEIMEIPQQK